MNTSFLIFPPFFSRYMNCLKKAWNESSTSSVNELSSEVNRSLCAFPCDEKRMLILAFDTSPYGVGAVISHMMDDVEAHPIVFASRTLAKSERNYSQIEALAIIFGVRKFHKYLYGRLFNLYTKATLDHSGSKTSCANTTSSQNATLDSNCTGLQLCY